MVSAPLRLHLPPPPTPTPLPRFQIRKLDVPRCGSGPRPARNRRSRSLPRITLAARVGGARGPGRRSRPQRRIGPAGEQKGLGQAGLSRPSRWRQGASKPWNPRAAGQWLPALVTCLCSRAPGAERGGLPGGNEESAPAGRLP